MTPGKTIHPKILSIVGARPQFIKAAALSRELKNSGIGEVLVHTGQHFDDNMADVFFRQMEIPEPAYNLGINSLNHGAMTGRMIEEIEKLIISEKPACVVVYGDTNSTLAGTLAAAKLHIPVAHVEAGLRSYNMKMPEEINRILTDRISTFLFCPTEKAVSNLMLEGFGNFQCIIENVGDVMYDVALFYSRFSEERSNIISVTGLKDQPFILCTMHRQENTDDPNRLNEIILGLNSLSEKYKIVLPLHPRTKKVLAESKSKLQFKAKDPVGYFDMVELLKNCSFVITDSGGLQKEAYFFRKQCLVIRDETEWTELVDLGYNHLTGASWKRIIEKSRKIETTSPDFSHKPYGDGNAARKIARKLKEFINNL